MALSEAAVQLHLLGARIHGRVLVHRLVGPLVRLDEFVDIPRGRNGEPRGTAPRPDAPAAAATG